MTPPSVGKLEKYVLAYANTAGAAVGRVRHWISFMMLSGALEHASSRLGGPRFIVKGGVALELRLGGKARATNDLDVVVQCDDEDLLMAFDSISRESYQDCTFTRRAGSYPMGEKSVRVWVQIAYRSQRWATVQVDLTRPDVVETETERVPGISLSYFGLAGPTDVVCLSLRYHIAQKLHSMTKAPRDGENQRFRDAVDLLLLKNLIDTTDMRGVREACERTFLARAEHSWPPAIALPQSWREPFAVLAQTMDIDESDLDDAEVALRAFLDRILDA